MPQWRQLPGRRRKRRRSSPREFLPTDNERRRRPHRARAISTARRVPGPWRAGWWWRLRVARRARVRRAASLACYRTDPARERIDHVIVDLTVGKAAAGRHMEGMIGVRQQQEGGAFAQQRDERIQEFRLCVYVARALQKQHRNV